MGNVECLANRKDIYKYDSQLQELHDDIGLRFSRLSSAEPEDDAVLDSKGIMSAIDSSKDAQQSDLQRRSIIQAALNAANKTQPQPIGEPTIAGKEKKPDRKCPITIVRHAATESDRGIVVIERTNLDGTSSVSARRIKQISAKIEATEFVRPLPEQQEYAESVTFTIASNYHY